MPSYLVSMWPDRPRESDLGHLEGATAQITYDVGDPQARRQELAGGKVAERRAR